MGPLTSLALFRQFEEAPEKYKYHLAPVAYTFFTDALGQLNCLNESCPCDDLQQRVDAAQYVLDYIEPYLSEGS